MIPQLKDWLERQVTSLPAWIQPWTRQRLGLPDPEPTEPEQPPEPDQPWGHRSGSFLWKPVSENDHKLVVIYPSEYRRDGRPQHPSDNDADPAMLFVDVFLRGPDGDVIENRPNGWSYANGHRWHSRWDKRGEDYPDDVQAVMVMSNGDEISWTVDDPARRRSPRGKRKSG